MISVRIVGFIGAACLVASCASPRESTRAGQQADAGQGPAAESLPQETYVETIPGTDVTFPMIHIPGGTFTMGSPADEVGRSDDEGPQRTAILEPFWMGVYEVRYDAYAIFRFKNRDSEATAVPGEALDVDAVARPSPPYEDPAHGLGEAGFPAVGMTQWGALQFARWLSEKTGKLYRLPTEAEWEYACRAGTTTAYPFGDDPANLGEYAWYYQNSSEGYHEPGQKKPNAWGLYDMLGNVAEWTMDQYEAGFYASLEEPARAPFAQPSSLHPRTVRGGAYDDDPEALRCANRLASNLDWKRRDPQIPKSFWWNTDSQFVGFRLVRPDVPMTIEEIRAFWAAALDE